MLNKTNPRSITAIEARLAELKEEKKQLLTLRKQLQESSPIAPAPKSYSPEHKIDIFRRLFRGRADIFANRWQNKQGRSGYSVACNNDWGQGICHKPRVKCQDCTHRQFTEINDQIIYRHLAGQQVVGLYPLMNDNTCYFLAADFDKSQWQEEVKAMSQACHRFEIPHAIEISRSGNGAHLWIFFNEKNCWKNVVTACQRCSHHKGGWSSYQAGMELLAIPFEPNPFEIMYLANRNILADQMDYLRAQFSKYRQWTDFIDC